MSGNFPEHDRLRKPRDRHERSGQRSVRGEKLDESYEPTPAAHSLEGHTGNLAAARVEGGLLHDVRGVEHTNFLLVTDGGGLNASYAGGTIRVDQTLYNVASGTIALTASQTNYVHVTSGGVVAVNTTGYPTNSWPMATITTGPSDIDSIVDTRAVASVDTGAGGGAPSPHDLGGAHHGADTLADLNAKVSDATLDDSGASRPPTAHDLAGALHSSDTKADLVSKLSDASELYSSQASEITGTTEKTTPVANDEVLIEDSAAADAKKSLKLTNLTKLFKSVHQYIFTNDDGIDAQVVAGVLKTYHATSGVTETIKRVVVHAAATSASGTLSLDIDEGSTEDLATATWTNKRNVSWAMAAGTGADSYIDSGLSISLNTRRVLRCEINTTVPTGLKDLTVIVEVERALTV